MVEKHLVAVIFSSFLAVTGWAATPSPSLVATTPQPKWRELTTQQKIVLAPLSDDWDSMENYRQKKWLGIASRFSAMTPEEQSRIQIQMQEWDKLTPEQRERARENFRTANQLPAEKKQELKQKWEEYSNLPKVEKEKLKQQAANLPVQKPSRPTETVPFLTVSGPLTPPVAPQSAPFTSSTANTPTTETMQQQPTDTPTAAPTTPAPPP